MLQPALQIISKVLLSNHPFWRAMLDIYKLSPIDTARIPVRPPDDDGKYPLVSSSAFRSILRSTGTNKEPCDFNIGCRTGYIFGRHNLT